LAVSFSRPDLAIQLTAGAKPSTTVDLTDHCFLPGQCPVLGFAAQQESSYDVKIEPFFRSLLTG
jgi:hypothetical protein